MTPAQQTLAEFDIANLPNLDVVVLGALDLFSTTPTNFVLPNFKRPIVIGSAGSLGAGKMMFAKHDVVFADESTYEEVLNHYSGIDGAIIISASGGKHAFSAARYLRDRQLPTVLLTNNREAPASEFIDSDKVFVFPKNREPYTYNTSTYLGMVLAQTHESPSAIKDFISHQVDHQIIKNLADYNAFVFIVPSHLSHITTMIRIKFEEMFMPLVVGRAYSAEEIKHAKAVIVSDKELFISLGVDNEYYGLSDNRLHISLPEQADYGAIMAIAYYLVGKIQEAHPAYFKNNVVPLCERMSVVFGSTMNPIVE
jgi:hypothetical protein